MTLRVVVTDSKHAGEARQKGFDLTYFSANFWRPGMIVHAGYCVRPAPVELAEALGYSPRFGPDGYEYVASIPDGGAVGMAGRREPQWGASTVVDGSLLWTRQPVSASSLYRTVNAPLDIAWLCDPGGVTVRDAIYVVGSVIQIAATIEGGKEGETYRIIARVPYSDGTIEDHAIDMTILDDQLS